PVVTTDFVQGEETPHAVLGDVCGPYRYRLLSDAAGLSQFGAFVEELPPGSASSERHWHANEDEMIYVLEGTPTLVEDTETVLKPGDCACWKANSPVGHCLINRSDAPVRYLVIGTRNEHDVITYVDHDLITYKSGSERRYVRRDGTEHTTGS
ncbi:MAG: cupin domain-containing protein, partial [Pseudomonadota bacterium]